MPSVSVIIGHRQTGDQDRAAALRHTLRTWTRWGHAHVGLYDWPGKVYSRAGAFNTGVAAATGEVVVCTNSDVIVGLDALDEAVSLAWEEGVTVYPFRSYRELTKPCAERWYRGEVCMDAQLEMGEECVGPLFVCRRDRYIQAGGCDQRFVGWGFEDVAWAATSQTLLGPSQRVAGECIHFWHAPDPLGHPNPDNPIYQANLALCRRYNTAAGNPDAITSLRGEAPFDW
jgi:hypothetical protein